MKERQRLFALKKHQYLPVVSLLFSIEGYTKEMKSESLLGITVLIASFFIFLDSYFISLRTSDIHLFYNLQLFYWHFLEILWLFIFLILYHYNYVYKKGTDRLHFHEFLIDLGIILTNLV